MPPVSTHRQAFWARHRGLVWSNPDATDAVHIRAALLHPRFSQLLAIAAEFGPPRLSREWAALSAEMPAETNRVRPAVERALRNIEKGFADAAARH